MALPALAAATATIIGGRLADRFQGHHRRVIVPCMSVAALALPVMAFSSSLTGFILFGTAARQGWQVTENIGATEGIGDTGGVGVLTNGGAPSSCSAPIWTPCW